MSPASTNWIKWCVTKFDQAIAVNSATCFQRSCIALAEFYLTIINLRGTIADTNNAAWRRHLVINVLGPGRKNITSVVHCTTRLLNWRIEKEAHWYFKIWTALWRLSKWWSIPSRYPSNQVADVYDCAAHEINNAVKRHRPWWWRRQPKNGEFALPMEIHQLLIFLASSRNACRLSGNRDDSRGSRRPLCLARDQLAPAESGAHRSSVCARRSFFCFFTVY